MNIPADFIDSIRSLLREEADSFLRALAETPPLSIRLNPLKNKGEKIEFPLINQIVESGTTIETDNKPEPRESVEIEDPVPWSRFGYYLQKRPSFTFDPQFHSGLYYVQEASSMFIEYVVRNITNHPINEQLTINEPLNCLDLCAAPGGKSVSMLTALPPDSLLTANEIIRQRSNILSETIIKYGDPNTIVTNNEPKDFAELREFYDLILVDAPCSGEGMFRKDETAISEWSQDNVTMCAARQKNILSDVWPALKPGGILIYSTCTYNTAENEENALWAAKELGASFVDIKIEKEWGISPAIFNPYNPDNPDNPDVSDDSDNLDNLDNPDNIENLYNQKNKPIVFRFFPHKTKGEGLFVAVLRKGSEGLQFFSQKLSEDSNKFKDFNRSNRTKNSNNSNKSYKSNKSSSLFIKDNSAYRKYLTNPDEFDYIQEENRIIAIPKQHTATLLALKESLKVVSMGIELGEIKGKDFIPSHALAMSSRLNREVFTERELDYDEAISYLRREAISIPDAPRGFLLLTYKNQPLGFVKNIGNRANNLYPDKWRIRT